MSDDSIMKGAAQYAVMLNGVIMYRFKICSALFVLAVISGCASNQYPVTIDSSPKGAEVFCNGQSYGYAPVTRYFELDETTKKSGYLRTCQWGLKWVSGATASANNVYDLNKFPNGVVWTTPRPNVDGYSQDAEFALKVRTMQASEKAANAAQQNSSNAAYQNNNMINCKKMGEFLNVEIKTFSGMVCPLGWLQTY